MRDEPVDWQPAFEPFGRAFASIMGVGAVRSRNRAARLEALRNSSRAKDEELAIQTELLARAKARVAINTAYAATSKARSENLAFRLKCLKESREAVCIFQADGPRGFKQAGND